MTTHNESPSLTAVGISIKESAATLEDLLTQHQLPQPSFSPQGRKDWSDAQTFPAILAVRSKLIDAAQNLLDLALGPTDTLAGYAGPRLSEIEVLRTFDSLNVAAAVPVHGEISVPALFAELGVKNFAAFEKQLRFAFLMGLFRQTESGGVCHTALSAAMQNSSSWVSLRLGKLFNQGSYEIATSLRNDAVSSQASFPCALADPKGLGRSCYEQLGDEPDGKGMERFSTGMITLFMHHAGGSYLPFLHGFDWPSLGDDATVVDMGGGNGHIEAEIAPHLPSVKFIVQDQASNAEPARELIEERGLKSNIQFQAHDFFDTQPELPGGRVPRAYMLIRVLQDWNDTDCVRMLKALVPSMERFGAKLWIMNRILPDTPGTMPIHKEKLLRTLDLLVFTLSGGGERSAGDLQRVLALADQRLKVKQSLRPLNSVFSFIEVVLD